MNAQSNTSKFTNKVHSLSSVRRSSRSDRIEAQTEDRAAGFFSVATAMKRTATKHESCSNSVGVHAPDKLSSGNQQAKQAGVSKSTKSNTCIAPPTSNVRDDSLIQSDKKQEQPVATISDAEQQSDEPTKRNSATANNVIACDAVLGLQPSSWIVALKDEDEDGEDQQRRRANFANKRKRHDHALQAQYNAIVAELFAAAEADEEEEEEEEEPQQDDNSEENTESFHDLFIIMEADEADDKGDSD